MRKRGLESTQDRPRRRGDWIGLQISRGESGFCIRPPGRPPPFSPRPPCMHLSASASFPRRRSRYHHDNVAQTTEKLSNHKATPPVVKGQPPHRKALPRSLRAHGSAPAPETGEGRRGEARGEGRRGGTREGRGSAAAALPDSWAGG